MQATVYYSTFIYYGETEAMDFHNGCVMESL